MTAAVILCSRMNSSRFPGKAMVALRGRPILWHVLMRARKIPGINFVVVAVPEGKENHAIVDYARLLGCDVHVGKGLELNDVVGRMRDAARAYAVDHIVRVTHDCPCLDPKLCGQVLDLVVKEKVDYASNSWPTRTFEKGLDCEAFTRAALEMAAHRAEDAYDREHVTTWIQKRAAFIKGAITSGDPQRAEINLCVDYPEDLNRVGKWLGEHDAPRFGL